MPNALRPYPVRRRAGANLGKGAFANSQEKHIYTIYDTMSPSSAATKRMFQDAVGQNSKTLADTNMQGNGQLPKGQKLVGYSIGVIVSSTILLSEVQYRDLLKWIEGTVVEVKIGSSKVLLQSPLAEILGCPFLVGVQPATAGNMFQNIAGNFHGKLSLREEPLVLPENVPFDVTLQTFINNTTMPDTQYIDNNDVRVKILISGVRQFLH
jgi:hypothetical protein